MGTETTIEWCHHTFNPWRGCEKCDPGCANCYAEKQSKRNPAVLGIWGEQGTRVVAAEAMWRAPLKWNQAAQAAGERRRVFCASMADVFEQWTGPMRGSGGQELDACQNTRCGLWVTQSSPNGEFECSVCESDVYPLTMNDVRRRLFAMIDQTPWLDWLLLTKRPQNILRMWPAAGTGKDPGAEDYLRRENVWLGTSAGTQATADAAIPELLKCRDLSPVLFVSAEPLLEPVRFDRIYSGPLLVDALSGVYWDHPTLADEPPNGTTGAQIIDWLIVGGESGPQARPCRLEWIDSIRDECSAAGVPVFIKQLGAKPVNYHGEPLRFEDRKGGDIDTWPDGLRVRQVPEAASVVRPLTTDS